MTRKALFTVVVFTLILGTVGFLSVQVPTVEALVPSISSVSYRDVGSTTWLDITVFHDGSPTPIGSGHYVSNIQLQINGTTVDLPQSPQSTETFTVSYNLGPNTNKYSVRARANCNQHGYSAFSNQVTVPEFSPVAVALFLIFATIAIVIGKKTLSQRANTHDNLKTVLH